MKSSINLVVIDSNFVLLPFQFKIDYFDEIRLILEGSLKFIIFKQIIDELKAKKNRESKSVNFSILLESGLRYIDSKTSNYNIEFTKDIKKENESTDDFLLRKISDLKTLGNKIFLATNDSALRKKAKNLHINTIFLRQKKYLAIERT
ncbi:MAG: PIN domain-containing protein [Candidatus Thorarchaeota archaeon]